MTLALLAASGIEAQDGSLTGTSRSADLQLQDDGAGRDMARKQELIAAVLTARETASGRKFSPALRGDLAGKMLSAPTAALEAFANAGGLGNIDGLVTNALGDSAADLVFTPVTPCRIVNTVATATPLAANTSRAFYVNGNTAAVFEAQGGNAGGCGIPDAATAVEMNFIAVAPAAAGDLRAFPWAASPVVPNSSVINYANVAGLNIANGLAQPVCNPAGGPCNFDLIVQADVAQSHLIIDVVGYYNKTDKAQVKSFSVNALSGPGVQIPLALTCSNTGGAQVTIVAPVAGKIVARADASYVFNHVNATVDILLFGIGTTATDACLGTDGFLRLGAALPTEFGYVLMGAMSRILPVAAGSSTTLFLNSDINGGTGHQLFVGKLEATFIPN